MEGIKLFLEKFKNLVPEDFLLKKYLIDIVKEEVGVELDPSAVTFQHWTLYIKAPAALKSELFIRREKILEKLEARLGFRGPKQVI